MREFLQTKEYLCEGNIQRACCAIGGIKKSVSCGVGRHALAILSYHISDWYVVGCVTADNILASNVLLVVCLKSVLVGGQ